MWGRQWTCRAGGCQWSCMSHCLSLTPWWIVTGQTHPRTAGERPSAPSMRAMALSATVPTHYHSLSSHPRYLTTLGLAPPVLLCSLVRKGETYSIALSVLQLEVNNVANVPVSIIASNRPLYLFRYCLWHAHDNPNPNPYPPSTAGCCVDCWLPTELTVLL